MEQKNKHIIAVFWTETKDGFIPVVQVWDFAIKLEERKFRMFYEGEREAMLFQVSNIIAEKLFGIPRFIPNEFGHVVEHPAWAELESAEFSTGEEKTNLVDLNGNPVNN